MTALRSILVSAAVCLGLAGHPGVAGAACTDPARPGVDWQRCFQDDKDLGGRDLTGAVLRDTSFHRSNLDGAILVDVEGFRAKFISATMRQAWLDGAAFQDADFTKSDLTDASLVNADVRRAEFFDASLRGADLTGARVVGADFTRADLSGATWTDGEYVCAENSIGQCN